MQLLSPRNATIAAIGVVLFGFVAAQLSILMGCVLTAILMWQCNARYLPALMIVVLRPTDFLLSGYGSFDFTLAEVDSSYVMIGGFPLTINLVMAVMIPARVLFEFLSNPEGASRQINAFWILLWLSALGPSGLMALMGKFEGNNGWADPIRSVFMVGAYFYGLFMARTWPMSGDFILKKFVPVIITLMVIKYTFGFHHRILWIWAGMLPALSIYMWQIRRFWPRVGALVIMLFALLFSFNIMTNDPLTFTLVGLFMSSLVMGVVAFLPSATLRSIGGWLMGWPAMIVIVVFLAFVVWKYEDFARPGEKAYGVVEKLQAKVFDDRAGVWTSSIKSIGEGGLFIEPAGRPWVLMHSKRGEILVRFGSHNTIIDQLRKNRLYSGPVILLIMFYAVTRSAIVLRRSSLPELKVLAIACLATGTIGVVTGHYPLSQNAGFWFLGFGGIAYGVFTNTRMHHAMQHTQRRSGPHRHPRLR
jgi:hypothetical protein